MLQLLVACDRQMALIRSPDTGPNQSWALWIGLGPIFGLTGSSGNAAARTGGTPCSRKSRYVQDLVTILARQLKPNIGGNGRLPWDARTANDTRGETVVVNVSNRTGNPRASTPTVFPMGRGDGFGAQPIIVWLRDKRPTHGTARSIQ